MKWLPSNLKRLEIDLSFNSLTNVEDIEYFVGGMKKLPKNLEGLKLLL